ncbi:MAG TPA: HAD-IIB family hydrolase [Nitrospiraceae bacterium]|nr:HAD-IIB family hydrolase [Nitrospiraceae bacterium]
MRYLALAVDYDGTLATDGLVPSQTIAALQRLVASGRKLILVTGRVLPDLLEIFPQMDLCERVVAENGALLYRPASKEIEVLAPAPSAVFVEELRRRGVENLSVGQTIVATHLPYEQVVLETIRDLGLELRIVFNKGAVMILPTGVTKASGLMAALKELDLSPHNVVAIGDGENDHALLGLSEYAVAVSNAVPMLQEAADRTTRGARGAGVEEIIADLLESDLESDRWEAPRHRILLGKRDQGGDFTLYPARSNLLLAGTSGSGKSTLATGILERLAQRGYQFCVIDPEGDYEAFTEALILGTVQRGPSVQEILTALDNPINNVVVNLVGLPLQDRPSFFLGLVPRLQELRAKTGRPHWVLVDETHHLLPSDWNPASLVLTQKLSCMIYVTVHPGQIERSVLETVDTLIALGESPGNTIADYCAAIQESIPPVPVKELVPGEAVVWDRSAKELPFKLHIAPSDMDRRRHRRKYAEGELPQDRSFYFRGPENRLNLRAQNLILFAQIADGVDDPTWEHHLRLGHYSQWFAEGIKDESLAEAARRIERRRDLSPAESRRLMRAAIEKQYTVPAEGK